MVLISYDAPRRFIAGTIGPPGQREFYLQASGVRGTTSVGLEKQQVQILAERINELLDEFAAGAAAPDAAVPHEDDGPLETPVDEEFRVGTIGLSWDADATQLVIELHAVGDALDAVDAEDLEELEGGLEEDPADDPTQLVLRVTLTPARARAFAARALRVVAGGRPRCPFCSGPIDPGGHICPRANGYRR